MAINSHQIISICVTFFTLYKTNRNNETNRVKLENKKTKQNEYIWTIFLFIHFIFPTSIFSTFICDFLCFFFIFRSNRKKKDKTFHNSVSYPVNVAMIKEKHVKDDRTKKERKKNEKEKRKHKTSNSRINIKKKEKYMKM